MVRSADKPVQTIVAIDLNDARVGITQGLLLFQSSPKPFGSGYFSKCCTSSAPVLLSRAFNRAASHCCSIQVRSRKDGSSAEA